MRVFNSFQLVLLYIAAPFLISYLHSADFPWAVAAFFATIVMYIVATVFMTSCVYDKLGKME